MLTIRRDPSREEDLSLDAFERLVCRGEVPPETLVRFPAVTGEAFVEAGSLEIYQGLWHPERVYFRGHFDLSRFPWVSAVGVGVAAAVFLAMEWARPGGGDVAPWMVRFGAKANALIDDMGQTWRLLTAAFVHRDGLHLLFNALFLFNVGGALENAYRRVDYLAILLASALGATLASYLANPDISAGASGMVFGAFGAVVVFGLRYRDIIPRRYQRFFGLSVLPYLLLLLWLGWMSPGVDNWSHLGGLLAGLAVATRLTPRLLDPGGGRSTRRRWAGLALVVGLVVAAGPLWARWGGRLVETPLPEEGVVLPRPAGWVPVEASGAGFTNRLAEPSVVQVFSTRRAPGVRLDQVADHWFAREIHPLARVGRLRRVRWSVPRHLRVDGRPAVAYEGAFESSDPRHLGTDFHLRAVLVARGDLVHALVFLTPARTSAAYAERFEAMVRGLRLAEPGFLARARRRAGTSPGDPGARLDLAEALTTVGATGAAREALATLPPTLPPELDGRARALRARLGREGPTGG